MDVHAGPLLAGTRVGCGCTRYRNADAPMGDLAGRRFGQLVAVARVGDTSLWRCRCDCGTETTCYARSLINGHRRTCGCRRTARSRAALALLGTGLTYDQIAEAVGYADAVSVGTVAHRAGLTKPRTKLVAAQVREIRRRFDAGEHLADIARDFPVLPQTVSTVSTVSTVGTVGTVSTVGRRQIWKWLAEGEVAGGGGRG